MTKIMTLSSKITGKPAQLTDFAIYNLIRNNNFDSSKAYRELGFQCRSFEETILDEVLWLNRKSLPPRKGGCIIDVSSMSAHITPQIIMPIRTYRYSRTAIDVFMRKMMGLVHLFPKKLRSGIAYGISKPFVVWYVKTDVAKMGEKNIRVISISPENFHTPWENLKKRRQISYVTVVL